MRRSKHTLRRPFVFAKAAFRQTIHIFLCKVTRWKNRRISPVNYIYFYPHVPHPYSVVYRVLHQLGITIKNGIPKLQGQAICFWWKDDTFVEAPDAQYFINARCLNISKEYVDIVHQKIFHYSLAVDPFKYTGRMVVKSNSNGEHDGFIVKGPVSQVNNGSVYQRVIDNRPKDQPITVFDIRVVIFSGKPKLCYVKYRPIYSRFSNTNSVVHIVSIDDVLTKNELNQVENFCNEIGLDYGEIDIVRDAEDKKVYILDVNKTPLGPPNGLTPEDYKLALDLNCKEVLAWITDLVAT